MRIQEYEIELFQRIQEFTKIWEDAVPDERGTLPINMTAGEWDDQFASWGELEGKNPSGARNHELRRGEKDLT